MPRPRLVTSALALTTGLTLTFLGSTLAQAEPATCLSNDPSVWPAPSKPYFMIIVDTSGSMGSGVATNNSCGYPNDRIGHARCAVKNTIQAFSGQVNFGLASYAWKTSGCTSATCYTNCGATYAPSDNSFCGPLINEPTLGANVHSGGLVVAPMLQDNYWTSPPPATNVPTLLGLVDNNCSSSNELGADSNTPLGGSLFNMNQYFSGTYKDQFTNATLPSPLGPATFGGQPAERTCRSVNVILLTDGDETCDGYNTGTYPNFEGLAVYEAGRLFNTGVTVSGQTFKIKTHVIGFAGATVSALNNIANAGGTGAAYSTANETQLSQALATIVGTSVAPETCDNADNNCNGCTDEGYSHYANVQPVAANCCAWETGLPANYAAQRTACLNSYRATITGANPLGDRTKLPCTTVAQQADPTRWLCYDPGERCDNVDNNGVSGVDENVTKCGSPLHCPTTEVCNGQDDNCDGNVDEGGVCGSCVASGSEVCDGIDNDCDGNIDNGLPTVSCGFASPPNCAGTAACVNGSYGVCNNNPQTETCDGIDNNCDGLVDNGIASAQCVPAGTPGGLVYGGNSACVKGNSVCTNGATVCNGFVGPSAEICDGIDNDCDGIVDNNIAGLGGTCGINTPPCSPGVTACVNGAIVCSGGTQPQPEVCDGIDNDCDGQKDEAPLADAPAAGANGCWNLPGNCCTFSGLTWCPPAGASCDDVGSLTQPCSTGTLQCGNAGTPQAGWICVGGNAPDPEACDGVDNDCNGSVDDGVLPGVGQTCGTSVGVCTPGTFVCQSGVLTCSGGTQPTPELCDGLDNDCDGQIDDGLGNLGGTCNATYDTAQYPGNRAGGVCKPGTLTCIVGGGVQCVGAVGPSPEVCDGQDNDCDDQIDESGTAPDGLNGTADPNDPTKVIGEPCGVTKGECKAGTWQCVGGAVKCVGGVLPSPEVCDCKDNDCDGEIDEDLDGPGGTTVNICGANSDRLCAVTGSTCQCVSKCDPGEFPCPSGQTCDDATRSGTSEQVPNYCIPADPCAECPTTTVTTSGTTECGPAGTTNNGQAVPVCTCVQSACHAPCYGVNCDTGLACTNFGANAGTCVANNCFNVPCPGGNVCKEGTCVDNPCDPNPCAATEVCKPTADFSDHTCVGSCAGVTCDTGKVCKDGACIDTGCASGCQNGQVCNGTTCVDNACVGVTCPGAFQVCDPTTGQCTTDPCTGVACPSGQVCESGECVTGSGGTGGAGGSAGTAGSGGTGATSGSAGTAGTAGNGGSAGSGATTGGSSGAAGTAAKGTTNFGLATGGGGCSVDPAEDKVSTFASLLSVVAMALGLRRRKRSSSPSGEVK